MVERKFTTVAHTDSLYVPWTGRHVLSRGPKVKVINSVAECIVHPETAAIACNGAIADHSDISSSRIDEVSKKAFALVIQCATRDGVPGMRLGQCGFIRCHTPTQPASTPPLKKLKRVDAPASMIKPLPSTARVSVVPVTALHNVAKDVFQDEHYNVFLPRMANADAIARALDFKRRNEVHDDVTSHLISFSDGVNFSWKYGLDVTTGDEITEATRIETDPNLSFEAVDSSFEYKVGQKIGMAVYRNYEFDFSDNELYTLSGWGKEHFAKDAVFRIFGEDNAVSVYTGEITAISQDKSAFCHSINAFRGCGGAIVFLLDKIQTLVQAQDYGKAIGVHVGTPSPETIVNGTESQSIRESFNFAFSLAGFAEKYTG